jgi:translation initiation factor 3 subunit B
MENGYHLYDFKGELLREEHIEKFKQLLWRPRPATLLSKEEQKQIRKNLREYSREFDEEDKYAVDIANTAIVEARKRLLDEWLAWRRDEIEDVRDERHELGLPEMGEDGLLVEDEDAEDGEKVDAVVEEIVEEIIEETEEIVG